MKGVRRETLLELLTEVQSKMIHSLKGCSRSNNDALLKEAIFGTKIIIKMLKEEEGDNEKQI